MYIARNGSLQVRMILPKSTISTTAVTRLFTYIRQQEEILVVSGEEPHLSPFAPPPPSLTSA